jgi:hypothetical protein
VLLTIPENSGYIEHVLKFIPVRSAAAAMTFNDFITENIVGCGHQYLEIATRG